jgi:hypothetical protein
VKIKLSTVVTFAVAAAALYARAKFGTYGIAEGW